MSMSLLRRDTDHAMRLLLCLASAESGTRMSVRALAHAVDAPVAFTHKVVQRLRDAQIVACHRGAGGGVQLGSPPGEITVLRVTEAVQGPIGLSRCSTDGRDCPRQQTCHLSACLGGLQRQLTEMLDRTTLADLAEASLAGAG